MKYFFLILLFIAVQVSGQEKYLVYFKDKGIDSRSTLDKNTALYQNTSEALTQRAIERRAKTLGEEFILYEDLPLKGEYIASLEDFGVEIIRELKWFNAVSVRIPFNQMNNIENLEFVEKIEKVKSFKRKKIVPESIPYSSSLSKSSDENFYNYGFSADEMELSDIPAVHNMGISGAGVIIGMIDAGFAWREHPALKDLDIIAERDFVYGDDDTGNEGDGSHGAATLSLAGGFEEGQLVAPSFDASFILAKSEDIRAELNVEEDNFVAAVEWMESLGADVISTSLGYSQFDKGEESYTYEDMDGKTALVTRAMEMAFQRGVVTVTSAGNEGDDPWFYITAPADGDNIISVGAVTSEGNVAGFSSRGPTYDGRIKPEIVALGFSNFFARGYTDSYNFGNGTSYAAPIVAGICGQLLSVYPHLNNRQLRQTILESGDNTTEPDNIKGYGLLSALKAVKFPNVNETEGEYYVNKIFVPYVNESSPAWIFTQLEGSDAIGVVDMQSDDGVIFSAALDGFSEGDVIYISFEYTDTDNNVITEPAEGAYKLVYGSDIISYNAEDTGNPTDPIPEEYTLEQNYPNPFNPATTIEYDLPESSNLKIRIYNTLGELVRTLVNNTVDAGRYSVRWGGTDDNGIKVSSGVYIYTLESSGYYTSKKMILLK